MGPTCDAHRSVTLYTPEPTLVINELLLHDVWCCFQQQLLYLNKKYEKYLFVIKYKEKNK